MDDIQDRALRALVSNLDEELAQLAAQEESLFEAYTWFMKVCAEKDLAWINSAINESGLPEKRRKDMLSYIGSEHTPNAGGNATERSEGRVDHNVGRL